MRVYIPASPLGKVAAYLHACGNLPGYMHNLFLVPISMISQFLGGSI